MAATPEHAARVLGLDLRASAEDVRRVRRELAMKYHPDCNPDAKTSTRRMARVNAAADTLTSHILGKSKKAAKTRRPDYTDFANQRKANAPKADTTQTSDKTTAEPKTAQEPVTAPVQSSASLVCVAPAGSARSSGDNELIRMAARSYRTVLQQISKTNAGPTVDARALRFTNAA